MGEQARGKMKTKNGGVGTMGSKSFTEAPSPGPRGKELLGKEKDSIDPGDIP